MSPLSAPQAARPPVGDIPTVAFDNALWPLARPRLSVVIPTFRDDASALLDRLGACSGADRIEAVVYDDGAGDAELAGRLARSSDAAPFAVRRIHAARNGGRARARNAGVAAARADWILLLDADMAPDGTDFLSTYLAAIDRSPSPAAIVGGFSLTQASRDRRFALHRWQASASECLPAHIRARAPGRYVFTSNLLVHRFILETAPFDEGFSGWGWEDVDWGLRVEVRFPVHHIDNPATHLGLDEDAALMAKYARSGPNFARLVERHGPAVTSTALYRASRLARRSPFRRALRSAAHWLARDPAGFAPIAVRGAALKLWRSCVYAEALP